MGRCATLITATLASGAMMVSAATTIADDPENSPASEFASTPAILVDLGNEDRPPEWEEAIQDLVDAYDLTEAQARIVVESQSMRLMFREEATSLLGERLGGFRFDVYSNVQHVLVTDAANSTALITQLAERYQIDVRTTEVRYSYNDLQELADEIAVGTDSILGDAVVSAQVADDTNTVVAFVDPDQLRELRERSGDLHPAVRLAPYTDDDIVDEVCHGKYACGGPLRGGLGLWRSTSNNYVCSFGYTATASSGSRWIITAGHCATAINQQFGHGDQYFGPIRRYVNNPAGPHASVDVGRIRLDNPYWRNWQADGLLLRVNSNNVAQETPDNLSHAIMGRLTIGEGDVVCLRALSPRWGDRCGVVSEAVTQRGTARVGNYDACPGDSGGAWVWNSGNGYWGYGVHEGGRSGCPLQDTGERNSTQGFSEFSTLPDINDYWDASTGELIRVDE